MTMAVTKGDVRGVLALLTLLAPAHRPFSRSAMTHGPEPEPRPIDPERFFSGADDCLRVKVECLIQGVREHGSEWQLAAETVGRRFTAVVPKWVIASRPDHLIDAKVGLVGVAAMQFNTRGEHRGTRLLIAHADDVAIDGKADVL